ncbi:MAG: GlxA family transcriptional regulator [Gammaproteobacteria bacterium]|jgi:transcriptional regulator GlxA family with amidase domain|nr:GlxA family transcriptional regulator [Gammaproteobacteria bacterium]MDP6166297.1 GlxA family transcriptional regulator [Gammaproteobacteria bacterium]
MSESKRTFNMGFLLIPEFALLSFAATIDPLRMANRMAKQDLYHWDLYTLDDQGVVPSNGIELQPTRRRNDTEHLDGLIVVASKDANLYHTKEIARWLTRIKQRRILLGATSGGTIILAMSGLLGDETWTTHWEFIDGFKEKYPKLNITSDIYEFDGQRMSCSGGTAALDMMLQLITFQHGTELANKVAAQCIHPDIRPAHEQQRIALGARVSMKHPRLAKAIQVMKKHIEEPISCQQVAEDVGMSQRQMERVFKEHLDQRPNRYYLKLRLEKARLLLEQSDMSILDIAMACGFQSTSHFSQCYKRTYQRLPSSDKRKHTPLAKL